MMAKRRAGCGHKSCFSDLNVILSESKGSNKELIQRMISCKFMNGRGHEGYKL